MTTHSIITAAAVTVAVAAALTGCDAPAPTQTPTVTVTHTAPTATVTHAPTLTVTHTPAGNAWGATPDLHLTPGDATTCTLPRPQTERHVTTTEKHQIADAYHYTGPWADIEFDHLIPFALCGTNDPTNIWPEPLTTAKLKDRLENAIIRQVKTGKMTLAEGQAIFRKPWPTQYCTYVGGPPCG